MPTSREPNKNLLLVARFLLTALSPSPFFFQLCDAGLHPFVLGPRLLYLLPVQAYLVVFGHALAQVVVQSFQLGYSLFQAHDAIEYIAARAN